MKLSRRILSLIMVTALAAAGLLTGCSSGSSGSGTPLSQAVTGEEAVIWYECQNTIEEAPESDELDLSNLIQEDGSETDAEPVVYGRETRVVWIKVFKDGKLTTYSCLDNVNLGHFSKMTDEEILEELATDTKTYVRGQQDEEYSIYLYTDAAGQEVMFEGIPSKIKQGKKADPMYFMTLVSKEQIPAFQVYDSYYGGYELYNYDETLFAEAVMVTRCDKGAMFGLDSMDLENAILDYKTPEEMLHELNAGMDGGKKAETEENAEAADGENTEAAESEDAETEGEAETEDDADAQN